MLQLVASKCLPILLYGTEACSLRKSDICYLDFAVLRFLFKLFRTNNSDLVLESIAFFNFKLPSSSIIGKAFYVKYAICDNVLCNRFAVGL